MEKETLEIVLQALQTLGAEGKTAFIVWVVSAYFAPVLGWLLTLPVLACIVFRILKLIAKANDLEV